MSKLLVSLAVAAAIASFLLTGCLRPAGRRVLELPKQCTSWGSLPRTVELAPNAGAYREYVAFGMEQWNKVVGTEVFVWADEANGPADVVVVLAPTRTQTEVAYHEASCDDGKLRSTVLMRYFADAMEGPVFAVHELGHALGLGHSTNEQSVMQWLVEHNLMSPWDDDHPPKYYRITEGDAEVVRLLHRGGHR